jgi:curved DNA-binding protein CbpA
MNYYVILGVPVDAGDETIRHAFRELARRYHPDAGAGSSVEKFRQIFEAYETLRDPLRRAAYDVSLRAPIVRRQTIVEPLRAEPTRAEQLRPNFFTRRDIIEQLFNELFNELSDDPFLSRPFPRW